MNNTWVTLPGDYDLPVNVSGNSSIIADFGFRDLSVGGGRTACVVMLLRKDYDITNKTFSQQLTADWEIFVCPVYVLPLPSTVTLVRINDNDYIRIVDNTTITNTYTYITSNSIKNLNLTIFIADAKTHDPNICTSHVAALQAGFRAY